MLETKPRKQNTGQQGFTLIELLLAMAVFSFMLLIVIAGFMNIVHMHNSAVASNQAQDNARAALDELVLSVRDSGGISVVGGVLCLDSTTGTPKHYYVENGALKRADGCNTGAKVNPHQITSDAVKVYVFTPVIESGAGVTKAQVKLSLTVGSANGTVVVPPSGPPTCGNSTADRTFCSVITLTSEAVQR